MTPKLSILICSLPNRLKSFSVIEELSRQAQGKPVEVLYLGDNKQMTVGEKRNHLVRLAKGDYIAFVDDDDRVAGDYVDSILKGIESGASLICFNAMVKGYTPTPKICRYSMKFSHTEDDRTYYRKPNHLMAWDHKVYLYYKFEAINNGEDTMWAELVAKAFPKTTEHQIGRVLYYYDFDPKTSEAQK